MIVRCHRRAQFAALELSLAIDSIDGVQILAVKNAVRRSLSDNDDSQDLDQADVGLCRTDEIDHDVAVVVLCSLKKVPIPSRVFL